MTRPFAATAVLAALLIAPAAGRTDNVSDTPLQLADLAWQRGDYVAALSGYLQILASLTEGPAKAGRDENPDSILESIALTTGELYHTTELTNDGALPQFSPRGRYITYETGAGARRVTRVIDTKNPSATAVELHGWTASISPDEAQLVYLKLVETPQLAAAQAALDAAPPAERPQRQAVVNALAAAPDAVRVTIRDLASARETTLDAGSFAKSFVGFGAANTVVLAGASAPSGIAQIYFAGANRPVTPLTPLTNDEGDKIVTAINSSGTALLFTTRAPGGRGGRGAAGVPANATFGVVSIPDGKVAMVNGASPSFSADGRTIVFLSRTADEMRVMVASTTDPSAATVVRKGPERIDAPAASPDGSRVAFQMMTRDDWDIYTIDRDGSAETRVTRDIQHDLLPQFLTQDRLLAVIGEPRHRRSFLYDLPSGKRLRLFHNNTVRTIAPEYSWEANPAGSAVLIVAERDGDTVSAERGVYLMDLTRKVTRQELKDRITANLASEEALRAKAKRLYAPIATAVKTAAAEASVSRIYNYEKALFDFDSKHISRPGNKLASQYLFDTYKSFGYSPEFQWFERANALGGQTANVVATLKGTVNPELIYVVSSHFDSVAVGPGADDDSSGTAALLETARILATRPQPATIMFASFTGEEAGLLGSREFVRRAVANKLAIVGALNNDMVGWANDERLDDTIRYSNPGIRDIQHAAAMQFSNLITYDALYYKGTDAAAYYEAFGDIVGGIGSYPVLSSPHYHQPHDLLENMNHQLITEVAKATAATLMLLASSPSRLTELKVDKFTDGVATLSWKPSPETGVTGYLVAYGPPAKPEAQQVRVTSPAVTLTRIAPGIVVAVKAINSKGFEGWDWARVTVK
jgi:hypothetical protein